MKFKPLGARALVQIVEREETTASGIVLPDTAKEKPQTARSWRLAKASSIATASACRSRLPTTSSSSPSTRGPRSASTARTT